MARQHNGPEVRTFFARSGLPVLTRKHGASLGPRPILAVYDFCMNVHRCSGRDTDRKDSQLQPRRTCKLLYGVETVLQY